ncbi:MAG TPA: molybdenum cofactor biosynthesis protein MoaE [Salinisphaeraceae bacterium]|nr:molybdenum cofactor biosynthesis protein MoaE [Salinisphaeraceae bacterium]
MMHLFDRPLPLEELLAETANDGSGALIIFAGTVRNYNEGRAVERIDYSAYAPLAERSMAEIETETLQRFDITACRVCHRVGTLELGEASIYAVVRAGHRAEAFEAARWAVEALKHRVAVWKHEHYADGDSDWLDGTALTPETAPEAAPPRNKTGTTDS